MRISFLTLYIFIFYITTSVFPICCGKRKASWEWRQHMVALSHSLFSPLWLTTNWTSTSKQKYLCVLRQHSQEVSTNLCVQKWAERTSAGLWIQGSPRACPTPICLNKDRKEPPECKIRRHPRERENVWKPSLPKGESGKTSEWDKDEFGCREGITY